MAMHDWNQDGKKDGIDNFIEYQIYKETTDSDNTSDHSTNRNNFSQQKISKMSTLGAVLCFFSGLFWQALLFLFLDIDMKSVPSFLIIVLWIVFSMITTGALEAIKNN